MAADNEVGPSVSGFFIHNRIWSKTPFMLLKEQTILLHSTQKAFSYKILYVKKKILLIINMYNSVKEIEANMFCLQC